MKKIDNFKMKKISGGAGFSIVLAIGFSAVLNFLIGVVVGYTNPSKCRGWSICTI